MAKPEFRNEDIIQRLPFRDWIRGNLPPGREGFVAEDLDLFVRIYGANFGQDDVGCFMLLELKYGNAPIGTSKKRCFGLLDYLLRSADPDRKRYRGFWVIGYDDENWDESNFWLNSTKVSKDDFWGFMMFMGEPVPPFDFPVFTYRGAENETDDE